MNENTVQEEHILKTALMNHHKQVAELVNSGVTVIAHDGRTGPRQPGTPAYAQNDMPWVIRLLGDDEEVPDYARHFVKTDLMVNRNEVSMYVNTTIPAVIHDGVPGRRANGFEGVRYAENDVRWWVELDMSRRELPDE